MKLLAKDVTMMWAVSLGMAIGIGCVLIGILIAILTN